MSVCDLGARTEELPGVPGHWKLVSFTYSKLKFMALIDSLTPPSRNLLFYEVSAHWGSENLSPNPSLNSSWTFPTECDLVHILRCFWYVCPA